MAKLTFVIKCPDQPGIIAGVTIFIKEKGGNIVYIDQYVDRENELFFMRLEASFDKLSDSFNKQFESNISKKFEMNCETFETNRIPRMAIFVSKYDHCLYDLLSQYKSGELKVDIPFVLSNHSNLKGATERFGIPFYHVPFTRDIRQQAEAEQLELLKKHQVDFIVLARYMQIVSSNLIEVYPNKIINIHHSFLPAFPGAKPYHSAYERGVKLIGATSHYVTEDLDAGPIIAQDVAQVSHLHSVKDLISSGKELEKVVLSRAVKKHVARKVLSYANRTVVFH